MSETFTPPTAKNHAPVALLASAGFTVLLFLAMALAQLFSFEEPKKTEVNQLTMSFPPPDVEELDEPEPPPPPPDEPPPELPPPPPEISLDALVAAINPGSGGAGGFDIGLPGMDAGSAGQISLEDVFDSTDLDQVPRPLGQPRPRIPARFTRAGMSWRVVVTMEIGTDGSVERIINVDSPHPELVEPISDAVRSLKYQVGTKGGRPVRFRVNFPFAFGQ